MEKLLVTAEDVKNELGIDLAVELGRQPKYVDNWLRRIEKTILNHIARYAFWGMEQVRRMLTCSEYQNAVKEAIIEQIDYLSSNNYVQPDKVMNTSGQIAEPFIAPLAHQILLNAGLLYTGAGG